MAQVPSQCLPGDAAAPGGPGYGVDAPRSPRARPSQPTSTPFTQMAGKGLSRGSVTSPWHRVRGKLVIHWPGTKPWNVQQRQLLCAWGGVWGFPGPPARHPDRLSSATAAEVRLVPAQPWSLSLCHSCEQQFIHSSWPGRRFHLPGSHGVGTGEVCFFRFWGGGLLLSCRTQSRP